MLIYVRSKRDKDAISHAINRRYNGTITIKTLSGKRKDDLVEEIEKISKNPEDFTIVLLGKEDEEYFIDDFSNAVVKIDFVKKARVRNVKLRDLIKEIEEVKHRFIFDIYYKEKYYLLGKKTNFLTDAKPGSDIYLIIWKDYREILSKNMKINNYPLVLHEGQRDKIYSGKVLIGLLHRPLEGKIEFNQVSESLEDIDIKKTLKENKDYFKLKLKITIKNIKNILNNIEFEDIVIPWSGGKDSTLLVVLFKKFIKRDFTAVFVDTGLEFDETHEYINKVSRKFGIKYETACAYIDKEYKVRGENYLINRECTKRKVTTLYEFIKNNFENPLIINGDRISESEARSFRPDLRKDEFWIFSPIKYWSFLDEQLFFIYNKVPWNPLYTIGFYRIGCKVCPFIDTFEKYLENVFSQTGFYKSIK